MAASYVKVILDRKNGDGSLVTEGSVTWTPSQEFPDAADQMLVGTGPVTRDFGAAGPPSVTVIANDTAGPQGDTLPGWTWNVTYSGVPGNPPDASYYVLSANGDPQRLSALASVPAARPGAQYVPLPNTPPADNTKVLGLASASPMVTEWVDPSGGGGGGGMANPMTTAGDTIYGSTGGAPARLAGNTAATRKFLRETGTGSAAAAPAWDTLVAGDIPAIAESQVTNLTTDLAAKAPLASPVFTGTPAAPTPTGGDNSTKLATTAFVGTAIGNLGLGTAATHAATDFDAAGAAVTAQANAIAASLPSTDDLSAIATANATAGNVPMNGRKFTGLANGSASTDSAAFGQIPTALPPNGSASGDLSGSYPGPSVAKVNGASVPLSKTVVGTNGSGQIVDASAATLANNTSGNAATATNLAGGATVPAYVAPKAVTLTFVGSGTTLVDASLGNAFNLTLTASTTTLGNPSNAVDGEVIRFRVTQGSGGSFTLAYASAYDFGAAGSPTLSTTAAKVDILGFEYVASISKWCYLGSGLGF